MTSRAGKCGMAGDVRRERRCADQWCPAVIYVCPDVRNGAQQVILVFIFPAKDTCII
jgi:hypothetical protein